MQPSKSILEWLTAERIAQVQDAGLDHGRIVEIVSGYALAAGTPAYNVHIEGQLVVPPESVAVQAELAGAKLWQRRYRQDGNMTGQVYVGPRSIVFYEFRSSMQIHEEDLGIIYARKPPPSPHPPVTISVASLDEAEVQRWISFARTAVQPVQSEGRAFVLTDAGHGLELTSVGVAGVGFEAGNYQADIVVGHARITEEIAAVKPAGRVVILNGPPGTGKTYFVRALMEALPQAMFIVIPSGMVGELSSPAFMKVLADQRSGATRPTVLILEDSDTVLAKRAADNMNPLSTLLNLSDGILGHMLNLFIVATANTKSAELDPAVVRKGRLLAHLRFREFHNEDAFAVHRRLSGAQLSYEDFKTVTRDRKLTLAELYTLGDEGPEQSEPPAIGFQ